MSEAIVIIATIGKPSLARTLESIRDQTFKGLKCLVVCDGPEYADKTKAILSDYMDDWLELLVLPQNTGANGYVCHRIYGAMPLLVNEDWILYCDDDNWLEPEHVRNLVNACIENDAKWAHSFRNIYKDGKFLCRDECESLGQWPVWCGEHYHIDTNCFCLSRDVAVNIAPRWHKTRLIDGVVQLSADTEICEYLRTAHPDFVTVPEFTVNYELGSWELSPKPEYFEDGNAKMTAKYGASMPWA